MHLLIFLIIGWLGSFALHGDEVQRGNFGAGVAAQAEPTAPATRKRNSYPYSGVLESHDAKAITLKGKQKPRVLLITPETRVLRDGRRTSLRQAATGERVSGSTRKNAAGKEEAITINLKGVPPAK